MTVWILPQAKIVAAATSNLCDSANKMVQGEAEEEKLIVAAKAVAASTAQLLIACQVKADASSENNKRLQVCGLWVWFIWEPLTWVRSDEFLNLLVYP